MLHNNQNIPVRKIRSRVWVSNGHLLFEGKWIKQANRIFEKKWFD